MKMPKVVRPEIEIEYTGIFGLLYAVFCVFKIGIKHMKVDFTMLGETVCKHSFFVIPKYKIVKLKSSAEDLGRFDGNETQDGTEGEENA